VQDDAIAATVPAGQTLEGRAMVHAPLVVSQQAVGCGHGDGSQTKVAGEARMNPGGQAAPGNTTEHTPFVALQHALAAHGFGVHVVPRPWNVPARLAQNRVPVIVHAPDTLSQHAPPQGLTGEHVEPTPLKMDDPVHPCARPTLHALETDDAQHAPSCAGHGSGVHVVPSPWKAPPPRTQSMEPSMVHAPPTLAQQAPAHGLLGEHVDPTPLKTDDPVHPCAKVRLHALETDDAQHAPSARHGLGVHVVPTPRKTPPPVTQNREPSMVHAPPTLAQQAPAQGLFGEQVEPTPLKTEDPVHPCALVRLHALESDDAQHAPSCAGHGSGVHVVPTPWNAPPPVTQNWEPATVHAPPTLAQQAPAQGLFGAQVEPTPLKTDDPVHP
jgi:hypothetical protein